MDNELKKYDFVPNEQQMQELETKKNKLDTIKKSILSDLDTSIFYKLKTIEGELLFKYIVIFLFTFKIATIINFNFSLVIAIIFGLLFTYINYDRDKIYTSTKQKNLDFKLQTIEPKPKNFKTHNNIIEFIYSIKEFRNYNSDSYDKMIQCIDNILLLSKEIKIGVDRTNNHIDVMIDNKKKAMNYLHSIIHTMETSNVIVDKYEKSLTVLDSILKYYIDEAKDISNYRLEKEGYDSSSKFFYKDELDGFENNSIDSNVYDGSHFMVY